MQRQITGNAGRIAGLIFSVLLSFMLSAPSVAAPEARPLPANGILGSFQPSALPKIVIDDQTYILAAGAQIRNQQNLIVQKSTISGPDVNVLYKKNRQGQIERIWILTDAEFKRISSGEKPAPLMPVTKNP